MTTSSFQHYQPKATPGDAADGTTSRPASPDGEGLPPPATNYSERKTKKTRISMGLRVRWDRFLRKIGSGTAPSTSSAFDDSSRDSTGYHRSKVGGILRAMDGDEVDEVVVDREWSGEIKSSVHSEHGGTPEKSHGSNPQAGYGGTNTDRDSVAIHADGCWSSNIVLIWLRYRMWAFIYGFFSTRFMDEKSENHYKKENWFLRKVSVTLTSYRETCPLLSMPTVFGPLGCCVLHRQLGFGDGLYPTPSRHSR